MAQRSDLNDVAAASRELHKEQLDRFAGELEWLQDPSLIPEAATIGQNVSEDDLFGRCKELSSWVIDRFGDWSREGHKRLSIGEVFCKHALDNDSRVALRSNFRFHPDSAFAPGLVTMSQIFAVVPEVATREGVDKSDWSELASKANLFGSSISHDGTFVQGIIRGYLAQYNDTNGLFSASKFKLDDESGIDTVTAVDQLVAGSKEAIRIVGLTERKNANCIALQVAAPNEESTTIFEAVWRAYGHAAGQFIYPAVDIFAEDIAPQEAADEHSAAGLLEVAIDSEYRDSVRRRIEPFI